MSLSGQVSEDLEVVTTWRKEDTEEEEEFCVRVQRGEGRGRKGRGEGKGGRREEGEGRRKGREEKGEGRKERGEGSSEELYKGNRRAICEDWTWCSILINAYL